MKRNIITNIEFKKGTVAIKLVEKFIDTSIVIFSAQSSIKEIHKFLKITLDSIEQKFGFKPKQVNVTIDVNKEHNFEQKLIKEQIQIFNNTVSKKDIDNILLIAKNKVKQNTKTLFLSQPLQFEIISNSEKKVYSQAPINKKADYLSATICINLIDREVITYIENLLLTYSLKIIQIFTTYHTISHSKVSSGSLKSGAVVLHCDLKNAFVAINKNAGTIASLELSNAGFSNLINEIAEAIDSNFKEAVNLFYIYANLKTIDKNRVIFTNKSSMKKIDFTIADLQAIIKRYLSRIFSVTKKFLMQKNLNKLPIIFSGYIENILNIDSLAQEIFDSITTIYRPTTFIEVDYSNENVIGVLNLNQRLSEMSGESFDTIVHTNPNTFQSLKQNRSKNIFSKFLNTIGGKYEWNN